MKLTELQQKQICADYYHEQFTQAFLAIQYCVSTRTIGRVLREHGLTHAVNKVSDADMTLLMTLRRYKVNLQTLQSILKLAYPEIKC